MRRTATLRGLGAVLAILLVLGFAADAYAQSFFDSLPSIQGLDSAAFAGDTIITVTPFCVLLLLASLAVNVCVPRLQPSVIFKSA